MKTLSVPWFMNRSIPEELHNTELIECQVRNIFNSQNKVPTENSCYATEPAFDAWKSTNFVGSCGIQAIRPNDNILNESVAKENKLIHGADATKGSWPWMASLRRSYHAAHFCGGVLISTRVVVSAAHCINHKGTPHFVVLGDYDSKVK